MDVFERDVGGQADGVLESNDEFDNPLAKEVQPAAWAPEPDYFDFDHISEDELNDLIFAFQAIDIDNDGELNVDELLTMIRALGADADESLVRQLMLEAKAQFKGWIDARGGTGMHMPEEMLLRAVRCVCPQFACCQGSWGSCTHGGWVARW
jgi:hypothetical protein